MNLKLIKIYFLATATAILSPLVPNLIPFMSDEALETCLDNFRDYNMKSYISMRESLLTITSQINSIDNLWNVEDTEKVIFTISKLLIHSNAINEEDEELTLPINEDSKEESTTATTTTSSTSNTNTKISGKKKRVRSIENEYLQKEELNETKIKVNERITEVSESKTTMKRKKVDVN